MKVKCFSNTAEETFFSAQNLTICYSFLSRERKFLVQVFKKKFERKNLLVKMNNGKFQENFKLKIETENCYEEK